jgi:polysaccharide biosynthesis protein PslH
MQLVFGRRPRSEFWCYVRILFISPSLPLPFGSADARWLNMVLAELGRRGHEAVCLSCTERSDEEVEAAAKQAGDDGFEFHHVPLRITLSPLARKTQSAIRPFSEFLKVPTLSDVVDRLAASADIIQVEHIFSSWISLDRPNAVTYLHHLETVDVEGLPAGGVRERLTRLQMKRATRHLLRSHRRLIVATDRLRHEALRFNPKIDVRVVPVGLDTTRYSPIDPVAQPVVGLIGLMSWSPSRTAAERLIDNIWPGVHATMPEAQLLVAGREADAHLRHLFPAGGAELLGEVPDASEFFSRLALLLYPPVKGTGMKIKVLEAMAMGIPVLSNRDGLEGLDFAGTPPVLCADTDDEFVRSAVSALSSAGMRRDLSQRGVEFVKRFGPGPSVDRLINAWQALGLGHV